ncbi:MAG: AmmeMemoRadiSam system protein B [Phycisphaerales bacterium]|nr:AmmeMemoRadiSam system protein B [Planctomycetota bacterium]MCH8509245.1 AmmeMemoRadiSam system protein B [Phycisphaerales bacterium]
MDAIPGQNPNQPPAPKFDGSAPNQNKPKLRKVRGFPFPVQTPDGEQQVLLGLADAQQISQKMVVTQPAFQAVLPLMDGSRDIDQIVAEVGRGLQRPMLEQFVAQLDDAALIVGPKHEAMLAELRENFDKSDHLPPGSTAQVADALVMQEFGQEATEEQKAEHGPAKLREMMDKWIDAALEKVESPAFNALPKAIVAPHLDYPRGWYNYAQVYGRMRVVDRPDRVVILGTNHFGQATGVCGCDKGFASPLGICPVDAELVEKLRGRLGDKAEALFRDRFDHENEHSIEFHIPWIQHVLGADEAGNFPKVFAALVHDPIVNNGESYDGQGLDLDPFVEALKATLDELGGTTLVVSSADLSHVGPSFGDQQRLNGEEGPGAEFRAKVAGHDREMLQMVTEKRMEDLIGSLAWQQNPTRWCSIGNMTATIRVVDPERVELLNYAAAMDPEGTTFVSSAAMAMW